MSDIHFTKLLQVQIQTALDPLSLYVCIYLIYERTVTTDSNTTRNIHANLFQSSFLIGGQDFRTAPAYINYQAYTVSSNEKIGITIERFLDNTRFGITIRSQERTR